MSPSTELCNTVTHNVLDVIIIGGGLSGLLLAHELHKLRGTTTTSWNLLEARSVFGGRLANDEKGHNIDLGGAWIWPQHQPNMQNLLQTTFKDIPTFPQFDDPSSTRIDGGAVAMIHSLVKSIPSENIILNAPVTKCTLINGSDGESRHIQISTMGGTRNKNILRAKRVVLAVPPKIASMHIIFDPPLSFEKQEAMAASHTWMAGVTKISLVYPDRFWSADISNMGLPGHIIEGPAFQVYDASTKDESTSALTFFALVPPNSLAAHNDKALADQVVSQIADVWKYMGYFEISNRTENFIDFHVKRWPLETCMSEHPRPVQINPHPQPVKSLSTDEWGGILHFASSEADQRSPGLMEGAVGAALRVLESIIAAK